MRKPTGIAVCLFVAAGLYWFALAGDMEPPGPPAPTMLTLQEIHDRLDELGVRLVGVPKTGQTNSYATGDDGEYEVGVSVEPRFTDSGEGTVNDNVTGLIWLKNANCFGTKSWSDALSDANSLADGSCGLTDGSVAGDWRLPNVRELLSLADFSRMGPMLPSGHPFSGAQPNHHWTSTTKAMIGSAAWYVEFDLGQVYYASKANSYVVWPVRGAR